MLAEVVNMASKLQNIRIKLAIVIGLLNLKSSA